MPIIILNRSDFISVVKNISKFQITSLLINPSFLVAMNKRPEMRGRLEEVSSLRVLVLIGSPVDYGQYENFINSWNKESRRTLIALQIYGMTEYEYLSPRSTQLNTLQAWRWGNGEELGKRGCWNTVIRQHRG